MSKLVVFDEIADSSERGSCRKQNERNLPFLLSREPAGLSVTSAPGERREAFNFSRLGSGHRELACLAWAGALGWTGRGSTL